MNRKIRIALYAALAVATALFAIFVWPTRYRYAKVGYTLARFDRLTGAQSVFDPRKGWVRVQASAAGESTPSEQPDLQLPLDDEALQKITGTAWIGRSDSFEGYPYNVSNSENFHASLYNGSEWEIDEVVFYIKAGNVERRFRCSCTIQALSAGDVSVSVDRALSDAYSKARDWTWSIVQARGTRPSR